VETLNNPLKSAVDWSHVAATVQLSDEERQIVQMLAAKKSLPEIGKTLGQHRSMIWRKVERIKARLQPP
jgi:DNA-binding CsgD family transcriptional regulator